MFSIFKKHVYQISIIYCIPKSIRQIYILCCNCLALISSCCGYEITNISLTIKKPPWKCSHFQHIIVIKVDHLFCCCCFSYFHRSNFFLSSLSICFVGLFEIKICTEIRRYAVLYIYIVLNRIQEHIQISVVCNEKTLFHSIK